MCRSATPTPSDRQHPNRGGTRRSTSRSPRRPPRRSNRDVPTSCSTTLYRPGIRPTGLPGTRVEAEDQGQAVQNFAKARRSEVPHPLGEPLAFHGKREPVGLHPVASPALVGPVGAGPVECHAATTLRILHPDIGKELVELPGDPRVARRARTATVRTRVMYALRDTPRSSAARSTSASRDSETAIAVLWRGMVFAPVFSVKSTSSPRRATIPVSTPVPPSRIAPRSRDVLTTPPPMPADDDEPLAHPHDPRVRAVSRAVLLDNRWPKHDLEDAVDDVEFRAWASQPHPTTLGGWKALCRTIALAKAIDRIRSEKVEGERLRGADRPCRHATCPPTAATRWKRASTGSAPSRRCARWWPPRSCPSSTGGLWAIRRRRSASSST